MSKILIIDDSEHFLEILRIRLLNYGYQNFTIAKSAQEGLIKLQLEKPDLIVLNTVLFDGDGFEVCRKIKERLGSSMKIILMAGLAEKYNAQKAGQAGADDYIIKTFDSLLLMAAIKKALFKVSSDQKDQVKIL